VVGKHQDLLVEGDHPVIVVCHAGSLMAEGDILWRRPTPAEPYSGPPVGTPPSEGWHPEHAETPAPRQLPPLDHDAIDADERRAAHLTYAVGLTALLILAILGLWRLL
jgi:hypothetical protein